MKKHVITGVALALLLIQGCGKKQDTIVNSSNTISQPVNPPTEIVRLLDDYSAGQDIDIEEILANYSGDFGSALTDSIYDIYMVTFLWGQLTNSAPTVNVPTAWDGTLSINGPSFVRTLHTIDFEPGEDSLVTEDHPWSEEWGSTTDNEFDGAVFLVLYDKVTPTFALQVLTFDTEPFTVQFDFNQLVNFYAFYQIDEENSLAVHAHKVRPQNCREGFFSGKWKKTTNAGNEGTFEGLWFSHNADTLGVVSGTYWVSSDGRHLMEGVVSGGTTNVVIAYLRGVWEYDDYRMCPMCGQGHGTFHGRVYSSNNDHYGYYRGEFGDYSIFPDDMEMPFYGKWQVNCVTLSTSDYPNNN